MDRSHTQTGTLKMLLAMSALPDSTAQTKRKLFQSFVSQVHTAPPEACSPSSATLATTASLARETRLPAQLASTALAVKKLCTSADSAHIALRRARLLSPAQVVHTVQAIRKTSTRNRLVYHAAEACSPFKMKTILLSSAAKTARLATYAWVRRAGKIPSMCLLMVVTSAPQATTALLALSKSCLALLDAIISAWAKKVLITVSSARSASTMISQAKRDARSVVPHPPPRVVA